MANHIRPKVYYLNEEALAKVWSDFLDKESYIDPYIKKHLLCLSNLSYMYGHRHRKFQSWLWNFGGSIKRRNGKYCIEFLDEKQVIMFSLKYL